MARSHYNCLTSAARGKIGDVVVKNYAYGQVLTRVPRKSIVPPSDKQLFNQNRWRDAAAYYWKVKADPLLSAAYSRAAPKKKEKGYPLNARTNRDFFNPPVVHEIDVRAYTGQADQLIVVVALDDFSVASVDVALRDAAGNVIEYGPAWQGNAEFRWLYRTKTVAPAGSVTFEAIARDLPGNPARLTQTWKPDLIYVPPPGCAAPATPASGPAIAPMVMVSGPAALDFDPRAG